MPSLVVSMVSLIKCTTTCSIGKKLAVSQLTWSYAVVTFNLFVMNKIWKPCLSQTNTNSWVNFTSTTPAKFEKAPINSKQNWTIEWLNLRRNVKAKKAEWAWTMATMIYSIYFELHTMNTSFLFEDFFGYFCLIFHLALILLLQWLDTPDSTAKWKFIAENSWK